jgi:hypothetical protein
VSLAIDTEVIVEIGIEKGKEREISRHQTQKMKILTILPLSRSTRIRGDKTLTTLDIKERSKISIHYIWER